MILTFLEAQTVKRLPTIKETPVQSLGWKDLLENEMATVFLFGKSYSGK